MSKSKSRNTITTGCIKYAAPTPAAAALQHHWKLFAKTQGGLTTALFLSARSYYGLFYASALAGLVLAGIHWLRHDTDVHQN